MDQKALLRVYALSVVRLTVIEHTFLKLRFGYTDKTRSEANAGQGAAFNAIVAAA